MQIPNPDLKERAADFAGFAGKVMHAARPIPHEMRMRATAAANGAKHPRPRHGKFYTILRAAVTATGAFAITAEIVRFIRKK